MMDFSSNDFVTSNTDLSTFLRKCIKCAKTTNNATFVCHHKELFSLDISKLRNRKIAIIINSEQYIQGHWITLLIPNTPNKYAIYIDSQNQLKYANHLFWHNIKTFSKQNSLRLIDMSHHSQHLQSKNCGYHCLYSIAKFAHMSNSSFKAYISSCQRNPMKVNETFIFRYVMRHFK